MNMITFQISFRCYNDDNAVHQLEATSDCHDYTPQNFGDELWLESNKAFIADEIWYLMDRSLDTFKRINPNSIECKVIFPDSTSMILNTRIINATHIVLP